LPILSSIKLSLYFNKKTSIMRIVIPIALSLYIMVGCTASKVVRNRQPVPQPIAKVYPLGGIHWPDFDNISVSIQDKNAENQNTILNAYIENQVRDILGKKGYHVVEQGAKAIVSVRFEVLKSRIEGGDTVLVYGSSNEMSDQRFFIKYAIGSENWETASLVPCSWHTQWVDEIRPLHEAKIWIDFVSAQDNEQLWSGEVSAHIANDDIRVGSNWLLRQLLWYLPTIKLTATTVPAIAPAEFDKFWLDFMEGREFYSSGQTELIRFNRTAWVADSTTGVDSSVFAYTREELDSAEKSFKRTDTFDKLRESYANDLKYKNAYRKFLQQDFGPPKQAEAWLRNSEYLAAVFDLLATCSWSLKAENEDIVLAGAYVIGNDEQTRYLKVVAKKRSTTLLKTEAYEYILKEYYVWQIKEIENDDYQQLIRLAKEDRERQLGPIDYSY
jgi:hypothetical protein